MLDHNPETARAWRLIFAAAGVDLTHRTDDEVIDHAEKGISAAGQIARVLLDAEVVERDEWHVYRMTDGQPKETVVATVLVREDDDHGMLAAVDFCQEFGCYWADEAGRVALDA